MAHKAIWIHYEPSGYTRLAFWQLDAAITQKIETQNWRNAPMAPGFIEVARKFGQLKNSSTRFVQYLFSDNSHLGAPVIEHFAARKLINRPSICCGTVLRSICSLLEAGVHRQLTCTMSQSATPPPYYSWSGRVSLQLHLSRE
jgi:hypothetical protein